MKDINVDSDVGNRHKKIRYRYNVFAFLWDVE